MQSSLHNATKLNVLTLCHPTVLLTAQQRSTYPCTILVQYHRNHSVLKLGAKKIVSLPATGVTPLDKYRNRKES